MSAPAPPSNGTEPSSADPRPGRAVIALAIGVILASGVAVAVALTLLRAQTLEAGRQRTEALAHVIEEQTARALQAVDLRLQLAAGDLARAELSGRLGDAAASTLLREQIRDLPFVRAMWVLDAQGRILQDSDVGNLGVDLSDRAYFRAHLPTARTQTGLYIGDPVVSRTMGGWLISVSRPLARADGGFAGVIVAALQPTWFDGLWRSVGLAAGDATALLRSDGMLLMRSPFAPTRMGQSFGDLAMFQPPLAGAASGRFEELSPVDGVRRLYAFRSLSTRPDLRVLVGQDHDAVLAPWQQLAVIALAIWVAAAAVTGLLSFLLARDLGRRFAAEQAMRQSVQQLNLALSGGNLGQWAWDVPSGRLTVNARWLTMLGLDPQGPAPTLEDWHARVHPEDGRQLDRLVREVIQNPAGHDFAVELRARHVDGREVWILDKGMVVERAADGSPLRVAGTHLDITESKLAEQRLRDNERGLAITLQSIGDAVIATDTAGRVTRMNATAEKLTGWTLAEAAGRPLAEVFRIVDAQSRVPAVNPVERVMQTGEIVGLANHTALLARGGAEYQIADSAAPIRDETGAIAGVVLVFSDVTEQYRVGEALRRSEARLRAILDSEPECVKVVGPEGRLEEMNPAGLRMLEADSLGQARAHGLLNFIAPEHRAAFGALHRQVLAGRPGELEFEVVGLQDTRRWLHTHAVPMRDAEGRIESLLGLTRDVTDARRLRDELARHRDHLEELVAQRTSELAAARQQAEDANRSKSAFLANMSHEIRTPLNAIVGLNYLLRRDGATPEQSQRLDRIDSASQHLLAIINDVLDLSKIEAGRAQLEQADFHLSTVLDSVLSIISDAARAKGLAVAVDATTVPGWLRGDAMRLRQALLNLASNAVKFTEQGHVRLRATLLEQDGDALRIRFSVEDSGIGLDDEQRSRLFRAFEQADASTTRQHGGTGLGLAITKRLAELMGGEAGADSTPGVGSVFWFSARLARGRGVLLAQPVPAADAQALLRERHAGARVLLVEDNEVNREVALAILQGAELRPEAATNGHEALVLAQAGDYALVLMDVQMPVMNGLDAARALRTLPGWAARPIVALTANAFHEDEAACHAAGMNDFLAKPIDPQRMYATLLRWLDAAGPPGRP